MKRGPDLDIEALFTDLDNDPLASITGQATNGRDVDDDPDADDSYGDDSYDDDDYARDDEYSES
ncbi:MAG: hypothetical protein KDB26_03390 [Microthrixaceae bacterium]|nr:hypothetical protein [Microthrixaceae bacterium]